MQLSKDNVFNYYVDGKQREVDFVVEIAVTKVTYELEFISPIQGDTMYS